MMTINSSDSHAVRSHSYGSPVHRIDPLGLPCRCLRIRSTKGHVYRVKSPHKWPSARSEQDLTERDRLQHGPLRDRTPQLWGPAQDWRFFWPLEVPSVPDSRGCECSDSCYPRTRVAPNETAADAPMTTNGRPLFPDRALCAQRFKITLVHMLFPVDHSSRPLTDTAIHR
jgi:hypothetical protein